jgi:hypothetical protein
MWRALRVVSEKGRPSSEELIFARGLLPTVDCLDLYTDRLHADKIDETFLISFRFMVMLILD